VDYIGCIIEEDLEWFEELPVVGDYLAVINAEYGDYAGPVIFALSALAYAVRAVIVRSDWKKSGRVKKYANQIRQSRTARELDTLEKRITKDNDKKRLPRGGFGDLMEMIETRQAELDGLDGQVEAEAVYRDEGGYDDGYDDYDDGYGDDYHDRKAEELDEMRGAREDLAYAAEALQRERDELRNRQGERGRDRESRQKSRQPEMEMEMEMSSTISLPDSGLGTFSKMDDATASILGFAKLPPSPRSPCKCKSGKPFRKCHMKSIKCPCRSGKKFIKCCAKKKGYA
jgi:hypothetical protein